MSFRVLLLGTGAAIPDAGRHTSCQVLHCSDNWFLVDCGEGAQERLNAAGAPKSKFDHIFISHLHGDHFFGLIGLINSYFLMGRDRPLHIYAPEGMEEIFNIHMKYSGAKPTYPLHFHVLDTTRHYRIFENDQLEVFTLPLQHRIPTSGFLFREKPRPLNIRKEQIETYQLNYEQIRQAKGGMDISLADGRIIANEQLTLPPVAPRSYAYCSDTAYCPALAPYLKGVNLLYHEATFCEDMAEHAALTGHSTAKQAASIALQAGVDQLLLGHFSPRYRDEEVLADEARVIFPATLAGKELCWYEVPFRRD